MAGPVTQSSETEFSDGDVFMSVKELNQYIAAVESSKVKQSLDAFNRAQQARAELLAQLRSDKPISGERLRAFLARVKSAAVAGKSELLIGRFPCELCSDKGRAINMAEPGWPDTLQGLPRQAYEVWKSKLQPLGYKLSAAVVDWPDGMPGEIGMFLSWK